MGGLGVSALQRLSASVRLRAACGVQRQSKDSGTAPQRSPAARSAAKARSEGPRRGRPPSRLLICVHAQRPQRGAGGAA